MESVFARRCVHGRNRSQRSARGPYNRTYGKFAKVVLFGGLRRVVVLFRIAGLALTDIHSDVFWKLSKVVLRGRRNTLATLSKDVGQFFCQPQPFGRVHRHFSWQAQHFRCVVLRVFSHRIGRAASSGDKVQFRGRRCICSMC